MLSDTIPQTREGAQLAVVIAAIQRATPWLHVDGVLSLSNNRVYALCFDERHALVVGFATLSSWQAYVHLVGTPQSEVAR